MEIVEISTYRDQAASDISGKLSTGEHAFTVDIESDHYLCTSCGFYNGFHVYLLVEVGEVGYAINVEPQVWSE